MSTNGKVSQATLPEPAAPATQDRLAVNPLTAKRPWVKLVPSEAPTNSRKAWAARAGVGAGHSDEPIEDFEQ